MRKLFLLTAITGMFAFSNISAQTKDPAMSGQKLGIGFDFALPTGSFNDFFKPGFGGSVQFQTPIIEKLNFTASAGVLSFQGKKDINFFGEVGTFPAFTKIPVKLGARYFILENFYAGGEFGAAFSTGSRFKGTSFIYTPNIGVEFPVSNKGTIDLGARYESWSHQGTVRHFALRLAYNFGL